MHNADAVYGELNTNGIVVLDNFVTGRQLDGMKRAFECRIRSLRWNNVDGYE